MEDKSYNSVEELFARADWVQNLYVNTIYKLENKVYVLFEEESKSIIFDEETQSYRSITPEDLQKLYNNADKIEVVDVEYCLFSAVSYCIEDSGRSIKDVVLLYTIVQVLQLDDYFRAVKYDTEYMKKVLCFFEYAVKQMGSDDWIQQNIKQINPIKEFYSFYESLIAIGFAIGYTYKDSDNKENK